VATDLALAAPGKDTGVAHGVALGMGFAAGILGGVVLGRQLPSYTVLSSTSGLQTVLSLAPSAAANTNVSLSRWRPLTPEMFPLPKFGDMEMHAGKDDLPQIHRSNYARSHIMLASYTSVNAYPPTTFSKIGPG
jgi:hypothetical protein